MQKRLPGNEAGTIVAIAFDLGSRGGAVFGIKIPRILRMMVDHIDEAANEFIWKRGKNLITLTRSGDSWSVEYQTVSRLLGPRQTTYSAIHRQARFAAWDVMARVINACHDEDEGLEVALRAAQWMRRTEGATHARA